MSLVRHVSQEDTEPVFARNVRARPAPMYNRSYSKTKSSYGRKKTITPGKALATAKRHNFKVGVERVLQRRVEVKRAYQTQGDLSVTSYNQGTLMNVNSMIPYINITQGTGQSNRIGNQIRTRKCEFCFTLTPNAYNGVTNSTPCPQEVVFFFGVVKNSKPIVPTVADFQKLFQEGNLSTAPIGALQDLTKDINSDWWTIRKMVRFKVGNATYGGTGINNTQQSFTNNDFKMNIVKRMDLTSICPKLVRFNDATQAQPTNDGLFMFVFGVPSFGGFGNNLSPLRLDYTINYSFEDA